MIGLSAETWLFLIAAPFVGSFLGVLVDRIPRGETVVAGRSHCDSCGHALRPRDLVPIVSWLATSRTCRYCKARLPLFYPGIELAAVLVVAWAATETSGLPFMESCVLGWLLLPIAIIDARHFMLPDRLTLVLFVAGLAGAALRGTDQLGTSAIGAAAGLAVFFAVAALYRWLRKREGLGFGDVKLLGAIGAWVSWTGLPSVILLAAAAGLVTIVLRGASGERIGAASRVPFGVYLALGAWLTWLYGPLTFAYDGLG